MSGAPRLAVWLLRYLHQGDRDAFVGDLREQFAEGRSSAWFWRENCMGIAIGMTRYWPEVLYETASVIVPFVTPRFHVPGWWAMPWPVSQIVLDAGPGAVLSLVPLAILGVALWRRGTFRLSRLLLTAAIGLAFLPLIPIAIAVFPGLLQPVPGNPHAKALAIPPMAFLALHFGRSLVAARVGCR